MVAGHLAVKGGKYYAVLSYKNSEGKRIPKWISLGLPEKGNKRKAEAELLKLRSEFEIPEEVGELSNDIHYKFVGCIDISEVPSHSNFTQETRKGVAVEYISKQLTA